MSDLKEHQPAMNVEDQINNLKQLGLTFENEEYAKTILNEISYFRLIKAYSLQLKEKNGVFNSNVSFEQLLNLYRFNKELRDLLYPIIEDIEVTLRCRVSNYFGLKYGVTGYYDKRNFIDQNNQEIIISEIDNSINRNMMSPFVKNFKSNYVDGTLPIYAVCEVISFGTLSKLYKNMMPEDKKSIASQYGTSYVYLESWMESLAHLRNICAHYGRLYNNKLTKTPKLYKQYTSLNSTRDNNQKIRNNRLFGLLLCLKHLVPTDKWSVFVNKLENMICMCPDVKISTMGFPNDWINLLSK